MTEHRMSQDLTEGGFQGDAAPSEQPNKVGSLHFWKHRLVWIGWDSLAIYKDRYSLWIAPLMIGDPVLYI